MTESMLSIEQIIIAVVVIAGMLILAALIAPKKEKIIKVKSVNDLFEIIDPVVLRCKKCDVLVSVHNKQFHIKKHHKEFSQ